MLMIHKMSPWTSISSFSSFLPSDRQPLGRAISPLHSLSTTVINYLVVQIIIFTNTGVLLYRDSLLREMKLGNCSIFRLTSLPVTVYYLCFQNIRSQYVSYMQQHSLFYSIKNVYFLSCAEEHYLIPRIDCGNYLEA